MEDCARGLFARDTAGEPLGSTGDIAVYSLYKTLPVPDGGLVVSDLELPQPAERASKWQGVVSSTLDSILARIGVASANLIGVSKPDRDDVAVYPGDVTPPDERSPPRGPSYTTACGLARCEPADIQATRRDAYRPLRAALADCDVADVLTPPAHDGASPFGVALQFPDREWRDACYQALCRAGYPVVVYQWPPCSPQAAGDGAQKLRNTTCVVPTHRRLDTGAIRRLVEIVTHAPDHAP
jgi:dTDP-4-amino-4,6-dideoxygalactose transaminase